MPPANQAPGGPPLPSGLEQHELAAERNLWLQDENNQVCYRREPLAHDSWKVPSATGASCLEPVDSSIRRSAVAAAQALARNRSPSLRAFEREVRDPRDHFHYGVLDRTYYDGSTDRLRGKLLDLGSSFNEFDRLVQEDTRHRRELDQRRMKELLFILSRIEKALATEVAERQEANQNAQQLLERLMSAMVCRVQARISERFDTLSHSVDSLCERCSTLERGIQQFKGELPSKLQVDTTSLERTIHQLSMDFEADRRQRIDRESHLLRDVEEAEHGVDIRMHEQFMLLERRSQALQELIEEFAYADEADDAKNARKAVFDHIAKLKDELSVEAVAREQADDQVVTAINAYSASLHKSLSATNTT